jgi:tol-pal system protein YbgF
MKKHSALIVCCLVLPALGVGCVMPDQLNQVQKDLADVRQQLRQVQEDQSETLDKLEQLETSVQSGQDQVTRADLVDLKVLIDQGNRQLSMTDERMSDLTLRIDRLAQEVQETREMARQTPFPLPVPVDGAGVEATAAEGGAPLGPGSQNEAVPDPEALYNTAYSDFSKGNYALAIAGFEEYQQKFPESALADNASYWVGECHFSQGNFPDAVRAFDNLLELYPDSDKAAAGNLKKALAYQEQNQIGQAIVQFRYVVATYEGSDEARLARDKLSSLGASF